MLIHIVMEVDERPDTQSASPVSAHIDEKIANDKAATFNAVRRGKVAETGHYYQVFPIALDLTNAPTTLKLAVAQSPSLR